MRILRNTLVLLAGCLAMSAVSADGAGGPAPNFTLPTRSGQSVSLKDLKGNVVMVNFWATWCGPCRQEMPKLEALYERYHDLGFTLLGVNVEEDPSGVPKFLKQTPVSFKILLDTHNKVSQAYKVVAMPTTVLIDRKGNVRYVHHGYQPGYVNDYQTEVRKLLLE